MKSNLLLLRTRRFLRSANLSNSIGAKVVLAIIAFFLSSMAFSISLGIEPILTKYFPNQSIIKSFNTLLLIYLTFDLVIRIMLQSLPTVGFKPLLILPIKRKKIAHHLLISSLFHFFNILPLFLFLPFAFKTAINILDHYSFIKWLLSLFMLIATNHLITLYIKLRTNSSVIFSISFFIIFVSLFALNYYGIVMLNEIFGNFMDLVISKRFVIAVFPAVIILLYLLNLSFLKSILYLNLSTKKRKENYNNDLNWITALGNHGKMLSLDIKMIIRNKRPRSTAIISIFILLYGFIYYRHDQAHSMYLFIGLFMTGIFSFHYGQFFPAWHSRYYPFLMSQNIRMKQILQSAFFIIAASNIIFYLLTLGYAYYYPKVIYYNFIAMLYNIGVNSYVILYIGLRSRKAIDLERSATFNYQGTSAAQWLISIPVIFAPIALYSLMHFLGGEILCLIVFSGMGITGILFHRKLIDYFTKKYLAKKHIMISSYKTT